MSLPKIIQKILNNYGYGTNLTGNDNDVVHKTGDEVIGGLKTFIGNSSDLNTSSVGVVLRNKGFVRGEKPSDAKSSVLYFCDSNGPLQDSSGAHGRFGIITFAYDPAADRMIGRWSVYKNEANSNDYASISLYKDADGTEYATGPSTLATRTYGQDILTRDWIPQDTRIVHTTGNEEISGAKTFKNVIYDVRSDPRLALRTEDTTRNTAPSATYNHFEVISVDSQQNYWWGLYHTYNTDKTHLVHLNCYNGTNTSTSDYTSLILGFDTSNIKYAQAPSTSSSRSNGNDIVTRDWIPKDTRIVHTTGDETIGGIKTFSESPLSKKNMWVLTDVAYTNKSAPAKYNSYYSGDMNTTSQGRFMFYRNANGAGVGAEIQVCQYNTTSYTTIINGYLSTATGDTNRYVCLGADFKVFRSNDADDGVKLGNATYRWSQLYAATTTISTSDERKKTEITSVPDNILDIWEGVDFCQFKMKNSVAEKGSENARIHNGAIAQSIDRLYKQHNIDISKYGLFCYDSWEKVEPTYDDVGGVLNDGVEAGDAYSLRYEEVLCMEAAYNRRRVSRVEERLLALEQELAELKKNS